MITPMQEVFAHLRASKDSNGFGEAYCVDWLLEMEKEILEKEKALLIKTHGNKKVYDSQIDPTIITGEEWYNKTFKTKER